METAERIVECRARGIFRKKSLKPLPGDIVEIEELADGTGSVAEILPRKNFFIRPPIANIDCLVIVASVKEPAIDLKFIDKMLVIAEANNTEAVICFNKCDLSDCSRNLAEKYERIGYKVIETSTFDGRGIEALKSAISGKIVAFTGFSGVGKSSLLNKLFGEVKLSAGEISKKLNRGKHTTRHVELFKYGDNSYIADTPGFSMLGISNIEPDELQKYFVEMSDFAENCRFSGCAHLAGKSCGVIEAVESGKIWRSRYENYIEFYNTLKDSKENY